MNEATATYRDGRILLDSPIQWPDGTRLIIVPQMEADAAAAKYRDPSFTELLIEHTGRAKAKAIQENLAAGLSESGAVEE